MPEKTTIIDSNNGLSPGRRQAIILTNGGILLIGPLTTNVGEILFEILISLCMQHNAFESAICEMASILSRTRCVKFYGGGWWHYAKVGNPLDFLNKRKIIHWVNIVTYVTKSDLMIDRVPNVRLWWWRVSLYIFPEHLMYHLRTNYTMAEQMCQCYALWYQDENWSCAHPWWYSVIANVWRYPVMFPYWSSKSCRLLED